MIEYRMVGVQKRKDEIIEQLGAAPQADKVVPRQDRVIIADLVISGVEKVLATLNIHLDAGANVLGSGDAAHALAMLQLMELRIVSQGLLDQMAEQAMRGIIEEGGFGEILDILAGADSRKLRDMLGEVTNSSSFEDAVARIRKLRAADLN